MLFVNIEATDFRTSHPNAWKKSDLNEAAIAFYGIKKFSAIQKSKEVVLEIPHETIVDATEIPVHISSSLKAKSVALFQDHESHSLIALFDVRKDGIISFDISIQKEIKGTLFAVIETEEGKLYYARGFLDILCIPCMRAKE